MPDREYFNERRKNRRVKFHDLLGGKCDRCGATEDLQFDHKRPKKKEFRIADRIDAPEAILMKEVLKCILMCASCHRDKTREKGEHGQPKSKHGTLHRYKHYGCRCGRCKKRMSEYNKERRMNIAELNQMVDSLLKQAADPMATWARRYLDETGKKYVRIGKTIYEISEHGATQYYTGKKGKDQSKAFHKWRAEREEADKIEEAKKPKPKFEPTAPSPEVNNAIKKAEINRIRNEALSLVVVIARLNRAESKYPKIDNALTNLAVSMKREDYPQSFDSLKEAALLIAHEYHYLVLKIARALVDMRRLSNEMSAEPTQKHDTKKYQGLGGGLKEYLQIATQIEMNLDIEGLELPNEISVIVQKGDKMSPDEFQQLRSWVDSTNTDLLT